VDTVGNRYELGPVIGVGSSAVVRRGRDLRGGGAVAIKIFHPGVSPLTCRQQRDELRVRSRLRHPGLVGLRGGGTEDGRPFVVTDLVEGPTLAKQIADGPLPPAQVRRIGTQLAAARPRARRRHRVPRCEAGERPARRRSPSPPGRLRHRPRHRRDRVHDRGLDQQGRTPVAQP